jgi:outer membrane receptor for ferrienterochelin and colicin
MPRTTSKSAAKTIITPGLRFDDHEEFGGNWSPSLNASHQLTDELSLKGGIARAYKTPNLYQSNPNYLLYSRGNGCNARLKPTSGGCYLVGNPDLKPEISVNKEIGLAYDKGTWRTSAYLLPQRLQEQDQRQQRPPPTAWTAGAACWSGKTAAKRHWCRGSRATCS